MPGSIEAISWTPRGSAGSEELSTYAITFDVTN